MLNRRLWILGLILVFSFYLGSLSGALGKDWRAPGQPYAEYYLNLWYPTLEGAISPVNTHLDFISDLNLGKYNPVGLGIRYNLNPTHHLNFSYINLNNEGSALLTKNFTYQGRSFTAGSMINTELKSSFLDGRYEFLLGKSESGEVNLHAGLRFAQVSSAISQPGGSSAEQSFSLPIPLVGINLVQKLGVNLALTGELSGASYTNKGNTLTTTDYRAGVKWTLGKGWSVDGGYRNMEFNGKDNTDNHLRIKYHGPTLQVKYEY